MKQPQSLAGYIRQHLAELETRLEVGVRQEVIVAELQAQGYPTTTLKGFRNFLYRARQRALEKKTAQAPSPVMPERENPNSDNINKPHPKKQEMPTDPTTRRTGFVYKGTQGIEEKDLI